MTGLKKTHPLFKLITSLFLAFVMCFSSAAVDASAASYNWSKRFDNSHYAATITVPKKNNGGTRVWFRNTSSTSTIRLNYGTRVYYIKPNMAQGFNLYGNNAKFTFSLYKWRGNELKYTILSNKGSIKVKKGWGAC